MPRALMPRAQIAVACAVILLALGLYFLFCERTLASELKRLRKRHQLLPLAHGSLEDELAEQLLATRHLEPSDRVLEFGGNIGRSSVIISSMLTDPSKQHLVLDVQKCMANAMSSQMHFRVLHGAISPHRLKQHHWNSTPYDPNTPLLPHEVEVPTYTWSQVQKYFQIDFNVLVLDCEGCSAELLQDSTILDRIEKVLLEHDFRSREDHAAFEETLRNRGFTQVDSIRLGIDGLTPANDWMSSRRIDDGIFASAWIR
jgi:FkbM family methyltransferase